MPFLSPKRKHQLSEDLVVFEMKEKDLNEVLRIENLSFPFPWTGNLFKKELMNPFSKIFLAKKKEDIKETILGYLCVWLVSCELHILNLAVHPNYRQKGVGTVLVNYALDFSLRQGSKEAILEVRESNYPAISLYRKSGFQPRGLRRKYYSNNSENAIVMGLYLDQPFALPHQ